MPAKRKSETPTLKELYKAYKGVCQITLKKIKLSEAAIEHVLPASKGGRGWANCVLVHKTAVGKAPKLKGTVKPKLSNAELNTGWVTRAVDHGKADSMAGWRHDE